MGASDQGGGAGEVSTATLPLPLAPRRAWLPEGPGGSAGAHWVPCRSPITPGVRTRGRARFVFPLDICNSGVFVS